MARKRYLKPGFFSNEDLAELAFEYRLVFQGLWLWADREGRIEDRPKRLKSNIMPYDNVDFELALQELADNGFITRYKTEVNGKEFKAIEIINFKKHQDVHVKEQASTIPAPVLHGASTVHVPVITGTSPSYNLELDTYTLNLELDLEEEEVKAQARKDEIEQAVYDYASNASFDPPKTHLNGEKEKSCAKKEKTLPPVEEIIERICDTAFWRNVVEHHKQTDVDRQALFRIFYEQKEDFYLVRLPSKTDIAQNFYHWVPIHLSKNQIAAIHGNAITKSNIHTSNSKVRTSTKDKRAELQQLNEQSTEFLRRTAS